MGQRIQNIGQCCRRNKGFIDMRNSIKAIIDKLEKIQRDVERYYLHAEEANAEERMEQLENEVDAIEQAIDILKDIE